jgi:hypothetical protein
LSSERALGQSRPASRAARGAQVLRNPQNGLATWITNPR